MEYFNHWRYHADPESILSEMRYLEEVTDIKKDELPEDAIIDSEGIKIKVLYLASCISCEI